MVTFTIDSATSSISCARSASARCATGRARPYGGAGANTTVQHAAIAVASGAANAVLVYRAFNERSGRRFGQPTPPSAAGSTLDWYLTFGIDTPAQMYSLWFRRYMDEFGVDQRGLRSLHGRRPSPRGDQPERVVLRAADHARRPPAVAVDRRAGDAAARLLPGERRRRRARRHHAPSAPATSRNRRCASRPRPTRISATAA